MNNNKKIIYIIILFLIAGISYSCKQGTKDEFSVNGKLENVKGSYFIAARELHDTLIVDTVKIDAKGNFSIKGPIDTLTVMSLYFNDNNKYAYVFIDKGLNVNVSGDVLYADLLDIKGGTINDDLTAFKKKHKDLLKKRIDILTSLEDSNYIDDNLNTSYDKTILTDLKNINFELASIAGDYVKTNPDKISSVMLINAFYKNESTIPRLDECLAILRGPAARFPVTKDLAAYSDMIKRSAEGATCPSFSRTDINDKTFNNWSLRGKYILLSFVSTTCEMCEDQLQPAIDLYKKFEKERINIDFVTVVINTEKEPISKEIRKSVKWTLLPENGGWSSDLLETFNVRALPFHMLISPNGTILHRDISIYSVEEMMKDVPDRIKPKEEKKKTIKY